MDQTLFFSLISLGFLGGFSHCTGMCGPFILTQVGNRLQNTSLKNFSNFKKLQNTALLPYHLGRITTYSFIGFLCSLFSKNLQDIFNFQIISIFFLTLASLFFLNIAFDEKIFKMLNKVKLPFKIRPIKESGFLKSFMQNLFKNPQGTKGYTLGIILGFIPCGLLYGAFIIALSMSNPLYGALGLALFGFATFPSLFLVASGGYLFFKFEISKLKIFIKIIALTNFAIILIMITKLLI